MNTKKTKELVDSELKEIHPWLTSYQRIPPRLLRKILDEGLPLVVAAKMNSQEGFRVKRGELVHVGDWDIENPSKVVLDDLIKWFSSFKPSLGYRKILESAKTVHQSKPWSWRGNRLRVYGRPRLPRIIMRQIEAGEFRYFSPRVQDYWLEEIDDGGVPIHVPTTEELNLFLEEDRGEPEREPPPGPAPLFEDLEDFREEEGEEEEGEEEQVPADDQPGRESEEEDVEEISLEMKFKAIDRAISSFKEAGREDIVLRLELKRLELVLGDIGLPQLEKESSPTERDRTRRGSARGNGPPVRIQYDYLPDVPIPPKLIAERLSCDLLEIDKEDVLKVLDDLGWREKTESGKFKPVSGISQLARYRADKEVNGQRTAVVDQEYLAYFPGAAMVVRNEMIRRLTSKRDLRDVMHYATSVGRFLPETEFKAWFEKHRDRPELKGRSIVHW